MFRDIHNFAELKKAYKAAARKAHPDMGGSTEEMQRVNAAYEEAVKRIKRTGEKFTGSTAEEAEQKAQSAPHETAEDMAAYAEILQKLFGLDGIEIELCGSWLWITGNTRLWKEQLKEFGCRWSNNKKAWYWYSGEYHKHGKRRYSMDEIRDMHGSETIRGRKPHRMTDKTHPAPAF